jgi:hypothetical protein
MYVPIAGNNVNIGRQAFIQYGEVVCEGEPSKAITPMRILPGYVPT